MKNKNLVSRRSTLKGIGAVTAAAFVGSKAVYGEEGTLVRPDLTSQSSDVRKKVFEKVFQTPFIDTHEHLPDESERLNGNYCRYRNKGDDWSIIFAHYIDSDMRSVGMPQSDFNKFFSPKVDPLRKWTLLEPFWPFIKNTGYGQAVRIAIKELYGADELSAKTVAKVQTGYEKVRQRGFYRRILCDLANIESCQVNSGDGFRESNMPTLLMQDIGIVGMLAGPNLELAKPAGVKVSSLSDWHKVVDWWFDKYAKYEVAVKSQSAYSRNIDYEKVPAEQADAIFKKNLNAQSLTDK